MWPPLSATLSRLLIDRRHGHRREVLHLWAERNLLETMPVEAVRGHQMVLLAGLLNHARRTVPRVREILGGQPEIEPQDSFAALAELPTVGRADLQEHPEAFQAEGFEGTVCSDATGGSTGTPMSFLVDTATQRAREASLYWGYAQAGWRYGEKIAMLWGSDRDLKGAAGLRRALRWRIENRRWFNAFDFGEDRMRATHLALSRFQPHLVVAYAGTLFDYARFLEAEGLKPDYPRHGIVSSAEVLTPPMREQIGRVFPRPVTDFYGNREFGAIAVECRGCGHCRVNAHDLILEAAPAEDGAGEEVCVTYLRNRAMPFLRYRTGDLLRPPDRDGPCRCGWDRFRIGGVQGRSSDVIVTADGHRIHGEYFTHLLYGCEGVRQFQFVQDAPDRYRLLLAGDRAAWKGTGQEREWKEAIQAKVGPAASVAVEWVDEIPKLPSGKFKFTVAAAPSARGSDFAQALRRTSLGIGD